MMATAEGEITGEDKPVRKNKSRKGKSRYERARFVQRRKLARFLAVQYLFQTDLQQTWSEDNWSMRKNFRYLVDTAYDPEEEQQPAMEDLDGAWNYAEILISGVIEFKEELDELVAKAATNWSIVRMGYADRAILRLAAFEMLKVNKILKEKMDTDGAECKPVKAATAINEAVELAHAFGQHDSPRFINGVLDRIRKQLEKNARAQEEQKA